MAPFDPPGGSFLLHGEAPARMLTPEQLSPEAPLLSEAAAEFMRGEVLPAADRLQQQEPGLMRSLLTHAGELGLLGLEIPEILGGLGLAKSVATRIAESVAVEPSFAVTHNVHTSVATFPLLFFASPDTKRSMLPLLASGEWIGAYALSEAHAGSDAMAARTRAVRYAGGYRLTGEKMWITNAAFADLFTVFARVDGKEGLTAFLVERDRPGLSIGREEHKLGLKGSSTCRLVLDSVELPAGNRIGEEGAGGRIALNTLNLGRFKIAASSLGRAKDLLRIAARYAAERRAFGKPIADFGLVRQKLARMAARIFAAESMLYRLAGCLDDAFQGIEALSEGAPDRYLAACEEYAPECAMLKVFCTETLDLCADECLQIHGGYGYTEEYPAARAWRDARVNRIYEGTNEINRFNVAHLLIRRARGGRLNLSQGTTIEAEVLSHLLQHFGGTEPPQEVLGALADLAAERYAAQANAGRMSAHPGGKALRFEPVSRFYGAEHADRWWNAMSAVCSACGDAGAAVWRRSKRALDPDLVEAGRLVARMTTDAGGYPI